MYNMATKEPEGSARDTVVARISAFRFVHIRQSPASPTRSEGSCILCFAPCLLNLPGQVYNMVSGSDNDAPAVPKRSLFKKSAWAKPAEVEDAQGLFSRSKEIFPEFVAENERRRKKLERSRSSVSAEPADQNKEQGKRRRISNESDDLGGTSTEDELAEGILLHHR